MHRFMAEPKDIKDDSIVISGDELKHLRLVLRLDAGDRIIVCDGSGTEYEAELKWVDKEEARARILSSRQSDTEPRIKLTLYQGLPKAEKMDWIIQKAVELGIDRIVPVITQRTVVQLNDKEKEKKTERWNRISREAAKQCKRAYIPIIEMPVRVENLCLETGKHDLSILMYENEQKKCLKEILKCYNINKIGHIALFIGPEGGFSEAEIEHFMKFDIRIAGLGKRILRTETASVSAISIIMYEMGEMQ